jgi:thioredoxin reductase (NADPH)
MTNKKQGQAFLQEEIADQLRSVFASFPNTITLYLFTKKGENDILNRAAREMIQGFQTLTSKIELKEYETTHELARKWKVNSSPAIVFEPERYSIRYLGVPYGEEGRTFLGMLILLGFRAGNMSEQSVKVLQRIDSPRDVKIFVSATCPYCPDQALNAVKAAIERPDIVSVDIIDIQANPGLAERYSAYSVPQAFANDFLIAQGAQPEELFISSLEKLEQQTIFIPDSEAEEIEADVVIIGGGPAGLTAGIYAVRSGLKAVIIEKGPLGGQIATTPIVENYPGLTRVAGKSLVDIMVSHALEYTQIFQGEEVVEIRPGDAIEVVTNRRRFLTRAVILATGAEYKHLGVPGEDRLSGRGVSYCATCDGSLFKGKRVVVVGGGDSAATEALYLHNVGAMVTIIHRRDALRAQDFLAKSLEASDIPILWNTEVKEIRGRERVNEVELYNNQTGESSTLKVDGVFIAVGYSPNVDLAVRTGVELTPDGYIKRDANHRTNIPGIYSAGDVEGGFKQIVTAAGQGSESALSVFEDLMHPSRETEKESLKMASRVR